MTTPSTTVEAHIRGADGTDIVKALSYTNVGTTDQLIDEFLPLVENMMVTNSDNPSIQRQRWVLESNCSAAQIASALDSTVVDGTTWYCLPATFHYDFTDATARSSAMSLNAQILHLYVQCSQTVNDTLQGTTDTRFLAQALYSLLVLINPPEVGLTVTEDQTQQAVTTIQQSLAAFNAIGQAWGTQDAQVQELQSQINALNATQATADTVVLRTVQPRPSTFSPS